MLLFNLPDPEQSDEGREASAELAEGLALILRYTAQIERGAPPPAVDEAIAKLMASAGAFARVRQSRYVGLPVRSERTTEVSDFLRLLVEHRLADVDLIETSREISSAVIFGLAVRMIRSLIEFVPSLGRSPSSSLPAMQQALMQAQLIIRTGVTASRLLHETGSSRPYFNFP